MKKFTLTLILFVFTFQLVNAQQLLPSDHATDPFVSQLNDGFTMVLSEDIVNEARSTFQQWGSDSPDYFRVYQFSLGGSAMKSMIDLNSIDLDVEDNGWVLMDDFYMNRWNYGSYNVGAIIPTNQRFVIWVVFE